MAPVAADMIRVVVVDDHPMFRSGLIQAVSAEGDISVVAEGDSANEAVELVRSLRPDIVLLDLHMSDSGIARVRDILLAHPPIRIIIVTASENETDIAQALEAGVSGYVLKGATGPEMRGIIRSVMGGENYLPKDLVSRLFNVLKDSSGPEDDAISASLSRQETQVLHLLARGLSNREIGDQLGVTERTIKFHLSNAFAKLKVRNRVEASMTALRIWPDLKS